MHKYGRVDGNQNPIVRELKQIYGDECAVNTSMIGGGFPDYVLGIQGHTILVEFKIPVGGRLTPAQSHFHKFWNGSPIVIAHRLEDITDQLRYYNYSVR